MRKWLIRLLLALLFSLLVGLAIGTWLRLRLERPVYYIGAVDSTPAQFQVRFTSPERNLPTQRTSEHLMKWR
jgi:hypothetical protein